MTTRRTFEIFSAGCPACMDTVAWITELACPSCEIVVRDMNDAATAERARALGVRSVPAVAIDGVVADCCAAAGPDKAVLRAAGLGRERT